MEGISLLKSVFLITFLLTATTAFALGEKVALVVGNYSYSKAPLKNPKNDVSDISRKLSNLGFNVWKYEDLNQSELVKAIHDFYENDSYDISLFYYAGHAVQVNDLNYILPVELKQVSTVEELLASAVSVNLVLDSVNKNSEKANILILDACRTDPFSESSFVVESTRSFQRALKSVKTGKGLASIKGPSGTLIAYATSPDNIAYDGDGRNGLYTKYFLKFMDEEELTIEQVFKKVRHSVYEESGGQQVPWEHSSLTKDIYFVNRFNYLIKQINVAIKYNNLGVAYGMLEEAQSIAKRNDQYELIREYKKKVEEIILK